MNTNVAGGELYELWGWACGQRGCKATLRHRREEIVRRLAREHQVEMHPELTGQMSLLDVAEA
jgi:hypothetical protein